MDPLLLSRRDLSFLLYEWLDVEALTQAPRFAEHSQKTFEAVIDVAEMMAAKLFAPHYQVAVCNELSFKGDRATVHPGAKAALRAFSDAGLLAGGHDADWGGLQIPAAIEKAVFALALAGNFRTASHAAVTALCVQLLSAFGHSRQNGAFLEPLLSGRFLGTICLSEPIAARSPVDVSTRADYECESPFGQQYRIAGKKTWNSFGEHDLSENIVHLVLARIPGADGLSLFLVPKILLTRDGASGERNDVMVGRLNQTTSNRGATTCLLSFGEGTRYHPGRRAGAVGYLVGKQNLGLVYLLSVMHEMRINVGLGAAALGYTAYLHALDYARNRPQKGASEALPKIRVSSPQARIIEDADVQRMLLAQKAYVEGSLALVLYCARLMDLARVAEIEAERRRIWQLLDVLTPVAASWPLQWCLVANDLAVQVHGLGGHAPDPRVEQLHCDSRLSAIHEGTYGLQALEVLGQKTAAYNRAALIQLVQCIQTSVRTAARAGGELAAQASLLGVHLGRLEELTVSPRLLQVPNPVLTTASIHREALGHIVLAWMWLEQGITAQGREGAFFDGKRAAARFFFCQELPQVEPRLAPYVSHDPMTVEMREEWY